MPDTLTPHLTSQLSGLLEQTLTQVTALRDALASECRALTRVDADALDEASVAKISTLQALDTLERERQALCAAAGVPTDMDGLYRLIRSDDGHPRLSAGYAALIEALTECRRANAENGSLMGNQRQQVLAALTILRGDTRQDVYGPGGRSASGTEGHALAEV